MRKRGNKKNEQRKKSHEAHRDWPVKMSPAVGQWDPCGVISGWLSATVHAGQKPMNLSDEYPDIDSIAWREGHLRSILRNSGEMKMMQASCPCLPSRTSPLVRPRNYAAIHPEANDENRN
jgi:hypothetical protein